MSSVAHANPSDTTLSLDRLHALRVAADHAAKREHGQRVQGDINGAELAAFAHEGHIIDIYRIKNGMAEWVLTAIRAAAELYPGSLQQHLDPVFRHELDHTQDAIVEAERRLDEVEDAIIAIERGEVANVAD